MLSPKRQEELDRMLTGLCYSFGKSRKRVDIEPLRPLWHKQDVMGIVKIIKKAMALEDLNLTLAKVKSGGNLDNPAWIDRPAVVPAYGTREFKDMYVILYIRNDFVRLYPLESVVAAIAHEFSHIILHSTGHPLQNFEEATDLVAMVLGYNEVFLTNVVKREQEENSLTKKSGESVPEYFGRFIHVISNAFSGRVVRLRGYLTTDDVAYANEWIKRKFGR